MQAKLLRVPQPPAEAGPCCRVFRRVGDTDDRRGDVRILAATNRDLLQAVKDGQFREDLYYRLAVITIQLPALRERASDIPKIVDRLVGQINRQFRAEEPGYQDKTVCADAISFVKQHAWPGNIRQFYNTLLQAVVMSDGNELQREDLVAALAELPPATRESGIGLDPPLEPGFDLQQHLNEIQRKYLQQAMTQARGVKAQAARLLGMKNYQTLDAQLKRLGIRDDVDTEP
jgi:DNA-binding NtrC family response regulator